MRSRVRIGVLALLCLAPLASGAGCSANAVAQSAATTAVNGLITNLINAIFAGATGG